MFINFWYPTVESSKLQDKPLLVRILGLDFAVFRDTAGDAHCLSNICVHRGGSLGHGKVKGDCIECSYHGWQYDGAGRCTRVPTFPPDAKIPARAKVDSYPVVEKYGLVFAFLGDLPEAERPPILDIEEYGKEGWRATLQYWHFDINYKRSMENGIDPLHNEFVHPTHGFSGTRNDYHTKKREIFDTEWGSGIRSSGIAPPLADPKMREASGRHENGIISGGTGHHGVASIWTHIHPTSTMSIHQYLFEAPIDEYHTSLYLLNMRNFLIDPSEDARMMGRNEYVGFQDRDALMQVRPIMTPVTNTKELFIYGDDCVARYRKWTKKWEAMGWRIDSDKFNATKDRVAYAIPSPARRSNKGWVIDAVPMIPAGHAQVSQIDQEARIELAVRGA